MLKLENVGPNQTVIQIESGLVLFSYSTPVAACINGQYYITEKYHSNTTSKHISKFIGDYDLAKEKPQEWFNGLLDVKSNI